MESKRTKDEIRELEKVFLNKNKKKSIEALSSIVFGIALSIGTFTFITSDTKLVTGNILTFAFSFLILIYIWLRYTKILELIKVETNLEMVLNILMLFLVVIEPYLFNQVQINALPLGSSSALGYTSFLFGIDIAVLMFALAAIYTLGLRDYRDIRREIIRHYDYIRNGLFVIGLIFVFADLPVVWNHYIYGIQLRFALWFISAVIAVAVRRIKI
ncbi:MAG TPA: hypothetical protein VL945_01790 [Candidatus Saccharimonadales bacterium]|nr:hypothetical protein [Candidatus Saccharimonadales bacterium]